MNSFLHFFNSNGNEKLIEFVTDFIETKMRNTRTIIGLIENYRYDRKTQCSSKASLNNCIPNAPLPTKRTKIFWKTLGTLAWNRNRPLGLRRRKLLLLLMTVT